MTATARKGANPMKKIHLHTAALRNTKAGPVYAHSGEDLIVGQDIDAAKAAELVESGGAIVVDPKPAAPAKAAE